MCSDVWYSGQPGRPEPTGGASSIQRNRDGVPTWSGEAVLFEEYVEACLLYEQTVAREKRYLCGPRLASELKGPARRVLIGRPADWLSNESGVRRLVAALRQERGQPKVPELSELLQKYFRGTRRTRGETMGDFILRKSEAYTRAQQSMARYMKWDIARRCVQSGYGTNPFRGSDQCAGIRSTGHQWPRRCREPQGGA